MIIKYLQPSVILSRYIRHYWVLQIDASEGESYERIVPTGNIELMFHYRNTFLCRSSIGEYHQPRSFISGLTSNYSDVGTCGDSGVIAVTFYPFGACNFLKFPLAEVENSLQDLHDIDYNRIKAVEDQIQSRCSLAAIIQVIEKYLLSRLMPQSTDTLRLIEHSVSLINNNIRHITATDLSRRLFTTGKTLERKFSSLVGK